MDHLAQDEGGTPAGRSTAYEPPPTLTATPHLDADITVVSDTARTVRGRVELRGIGANPVGSTTAAAATPPVASASDVGIQPAGPVVELVGPHGERFVAVRASEDGSFTLSAPAAGVYHLRVLHPELGAATSRGFELPEGSGALVVLRMGVR